MHFQIKTEISIALNNAEAYGKNRSKCDKSVKLGTKNTVVHALSENRDTHVILSNLWRSS